MEIHPLFILLTQVSSLELAYLVFCHWMIQVVPVLTDNTAINEKVIPKKQSGITTISRIFTEHCSLRISRTISELEIIKYISPDKHTAQCAPRMSSTKLKMNSRCFYLPGVFILLSFFSSFPMLTDPKRTNLFSHFHQLYENLFFSVARHESQLRQQIILDK
jgi:hypothetical protein